MVRTMEASATLGERVAALNVRGRKREVSHVREDKKVKRSDKNRPVEQPIGRRGRRFEGRVKDGDGGLLGGKKQRKVMDPRFEAHCGHFNEGLFEKSYAFVEDIRQAEMKTLRERVKQERHGETGGTNSYAAQLQTLENQTAKQKIHERQKKIAREFKRQERDKVKQGKQPYFLSQRKLKELELKEQFQELKSTGKLQKYIEKRRKKQASKDKRLLPNGRE